MADTYVGSCKVCEIETDLVEGMCQECLLKEVSKNASSMARLSHQSRKQKLGVDGYKKAMQAIAKMPRKRRPYAK